VLELATDSGWLAAITNAPMAQTQAEEAD